MANNSVLDRIKNNREKRNQYRAVTKELKEARKREKEEIKKIKRTDKDQIKALKKAKKYEELYDKYGSDIFLENASGKYKKQDAEKLFKEGRYTDLYEKYGEAIYKKYMYKIMAQDVYNETGSKPKSVFNRIKNVIAHRIAPVALSTLLIGPPVLGTEMGFFIENQRRGNEVEYAERIETYNKNINEYAEQIRGMNLTDTQIFMKLMDDMWKQIDGYKHPDEPDIAGYYRLTLQNENIGVCRHFADDMTAKLNAINPEYNARNIVVFMSDNEYHFANIKRNVIESNETVAENNEKKEDTELSNNDSLAKVVGNHMVTAVDIPGQDLTLILDPTNPGIGVFIDGKIHMFSTEDGRGLNPKLVGQFFQGINDFTDLGLTTLKSFKQNDFSLEKLEQIYGTKAQNEALAYLASIESPTLANEDSFIPKATVNEQEAISKMNANINQKSANRDFENLDK